MHAERIRFFVWMFCCLLNMINEQPSPALGIPKREELVKIFPADWDLNWAVESETFPKFVKLLKFKEYSEKLLLGLIVSVGGCTERLVKNSCLSLLTELAEMQR